MVSYYLMSPSVHSVISDLFFCGMAAEEGDPGFDHGGLHFLDYDDDGAGHGFGMPDDMFLVDEDPMEDLHFCGAGGPDMDQRLPSPTTCNSQSVNIYVNII